MPYKYTIYTLSHNGEIRYVGVTTRTPEARLREHLGHARNPNSAMHNTYKSRWIRSVNFDVVTTPFLSTNDLEQEHEIIMDMLSKGVRLVNTSRGGRCQWKHGMPDHIKQSIAEKNRNDFQRHAKISKAMTGKAKSDEHRRKISKTLMGRPRDPKTTAKTYKAVNQFSKEGVFIRSFESVTAANKFYGNCPRNSSIGRVCNGKQKTTMKCLWEWREDMVSSA